MIVEREMLKYDEGRRRRRRRRRGCCLAGSQRLRHRYYPPLEYLQWAF
jgi:hypothetical protein